LPVGDETLVVATEDVIFGDVAVVIVLVRIILMDEVDMMVVWPPICRHSLQRYG
jgi:hypothetical protein